ncbi:transcriptional regulator [Opitutaceae bacterium EW11]|nr:transcriptional regulator [Opitutaceae bacterium EW11]
MNPAKITIAVLDRNAADLAALTRSLKDGGYRVLSATTEAQVEKLAADGPLNLVVKGFEGGNVDALSLMQRIRALCRDTEFILCGRGGSIEAAVDAIHQGACDYLTKPVDPAALLEAIRRALERQALVAEDPKLRLSLKRRSDPDVFVGTSPRMQALASVIEEVAPTQVPVLVTGESGTGKELVARAVHERSQKRSGPFVAINCAGLPDSLIEAELFGHVRGAFTGAVGDRIGAFKLADGGTLFLDEIGDLAPKGQGDLLRVLEDGAYRPVGSSKPVRADVRIVAATNRDLSAWSNEGRFRSDLLYRLNIVDLHLPPLRERREDIPALVQSFNLHFSARHKRRPKTFTREFMARLAQHPWPGNIRQLRNLVERLVVTVRASEIGADFAPAPEPEPRAAAADEILFSVRRGMTIDQIEAQLIRTTLSQVTSRRDEAAKLLGMSRRALHYKLKRLGA